MRRSPELIPDRTFEMSRVAAPEVLRVLANRHARWLRLLESRVGSREAAEDILQDAMAKAAASGAQIRHRESVLAWFDRVLRNAIADHVAASGSCAGPAQSTGVSTVPAGRAAIRGGGAAPFKRSERLPRL